MRTLLALAALLAVSFASACDTSTTCKDDFDCDGALVCRVSAGVCEPFKCKSDDDCGDGQRCEDNQCFANAAGTPTR